MGNHLGGNSHVACIGRQPGYGDVLGMEQDDNGERYEALFFLSFSISLSSLACSQRDCGHILIDMYLILPPSCLGEFNTYCFFVHGGSWLS